MKVNMYYFEYMSFEGQVKEVDGRKVQVPFVNAFAHKEWKYWYVYEYSTGMKISGEAGKTMKEAVRIATDKLNSIGEVDVKKAIASKPIINQ
jgi:hypothetical protein